VLKEMASDYDIKLNMQLEHQSKQLNQRHKNDVNTLKSEMEEEREILFQHVKTEANASKQEEKKIYTTALLQQNALQQEEQLTQALENNANALKQTFVAHIDALNQEHATTVEKMQQQTLLLTTKITQLNEKVERIESEKEQLTHVYEEKYKDAYQEVQKAMALSTNNSKQKEEKHMLEQMKLTTAMKKEIDQVKQNATEIVQAKLEKMATLMEKQHIGGKFFSFVGKLFPSPFSSVFPSRLTFFSLFA